MEQIVYADSNADFLNKVYGTNYKAFMRGRYPLDSQTWVWMIRLDGKERQGWRNRVINENEIWEEYVGKEQSSYNATEERKYRSWYQSRICHRDGRITFSADVVLRPKKAKLDGMF